MTTGKHPREQPLLYQMTPVTTGPNKNTRVFFITIRKEVVLLAAFSYHYAAAKLKEQSQYVESIALLPFRVHGDVQFHAVIRV